MLLYRTLSTAVIALAAFAAASCASTATTADGRELRLTSPEFRQYVEGVFREQNEVGTELAFALEEAGAAGSTDLAAAEDELLAACAALNGLAIARRDERRLTLAERVRAAREAPRCERAAAAARAALDSHAR